jgi:hypothetical protein
MSLPPASPFLPELQKLFPELTQQLNCLNGDYVSHQSAASIVRCMRGMLSDPCHLLPESLLNPNCPSSGTSDSHFREVQLKKEALDDLKNLVSESAFKCAPRFPGRIPSLINVTDKKSMIFEPELYPGYVIPKIGFCFDTTDGDLVMDAGCTKIGLIVDRAKNQGTGSVSVKWNNEAKMSDEDIGKLQIFAKIRVLITFKKDLPEEPLSKFCEINAAFTVSDQAPTELVTFSDSKSSDSSKDFVIKRDKDSLDLFVKDVVYEQNAKTALLDQCHEYTVLRGVACRLADSFNQLSKLAGELKNLTDLKTQVDAIEKKNDVGNGQTAKPDNEKAKEERELKAKWEDQKGTYDRIKDGKMC